MAKEDRRWGTAPASPAQVLQEKWWMEGCSSKHVPAVRICAERILGLEEDIEQLSAQRHIDEVVALIVDFQKIARGFGVTIVSRCDHSVSCPKGCSALGCRHADVALRTFESPLFASKQARKVHGVRLDTVSGPELFISDLLRKPNTCRQQYAHIPERQWRGVLDAATTVDQLAFKVSNNVEVTESFLKTVALDVVNMMRSVGVDVRFRFPKKGKHVKENN